MKNHFFVFIATFAMAGAANAAEPRKSSTHPDLSGTYDVATLTPLQRPKAFGDNLFLSAEQAEKMAARAAARQSKGAQASDPNRKAPPAGGDGSAGAAGNVGGYNTFWIDAGEKAIEVDGKFRTSIITQPKNGRFPAVTAKTMERFMAMQARFARKNDGTAWWLEIDGPGPFDNMETRANGERCLLSFGSTSGPPMLPALYNNVKRIVQTDQHVMILAEMIHDARVIRLNSEHPPAEITYWMGDSIGHWEGDTLVVDTTNFKDKPALRGTDENLHVVERFSRMADGNLLYQFTVEDSTVWQEPWGGEYPWPATTDKVYEYACHEGNYALGNIMRGARLLEQQAQADSGN